MGQTVHALGTWSVRFPGVRLLVSWNGNNDQTCVGVYHVCLWTPLTAASIQGSCRRVLASWRRC